MEINERTSSSCEEIKVGKRILVMILLSIPVVNLVMLIVWSVSHNTNKCLKNFARATFVMMLIWIVLMFIIAGTGYGHRMMMY